MFYQEFSSEVDLKYGGRETSRCCSVSSRSKDGMAGLTDHNIYKSTNLKLLTVIQKIKINKEKCLSRFNGSCPHSYELFVATKGPNPEVIFKKIL